MRFVIVIPTWVAVGLVVALVMRRRGHDLAVWLVMGVALGPFSVPLAFQRVRRAPSVQPRQTVAGTALLGSVASHLARGSTVPVIIGRRSGELTNTS